MNKIVECVPNFSEGRNQDTINAIAEAIKSTSGVSLLDVDPGKSTNRTVYTFVGSPDAVVDAAIAAARTAKSRIDMTKQTGEHPRMGALDVCPFVPVAGVTMRECVDCANEFGRRAADELGIPVYLYEEAARFERRKKLPDIRKGEYEAVKDKIILPEWKPDFGPAEFIPEWGATAAGARFFLIAYNVNIIGTHNQAHRIALNLREAGRGKGYAGRLKECKAMGWWVDEYNMAQLTCNLTNYKVTPPHILFEEVRNDAAELNIATAGSELVGLIPLEAMLMAADYYIEKENLFILEEDQKIKLVIDRLGLNSISAFEPDKRIIEYIIKDEPAEPLAGSTVREFIEKIAARTSAPGGGSAAAAIAAIGAGLAAMVARLTYGVRKFEHLDKDMRKIIPPLFDAANSLIPMIDADTDAFNDYLEAVRLPKDTAEAIAKRDEAMQDGLKSAIEVPLLTMKLGDAAWEAMIGIAKLGNIASASDIEVGARALEVGIWGAYRNVMINLPDIKDISYKKAIKEEAETIAAKAKTYCEDILTTIDNRQKAAPHK